MMTITGDKIKYQNSSLQYYKTCGLLIYDTHNIT